MALYASSVEGLEQLIKSFNKLATSEHHNAYLLAATKKSAQRLQIEMQKHLMSNGSIDTGRLWSSIYIKQQSLRSKKYSREYLYVTFIVGPRTSTMNGPKGVGYGHLVELGHDLRRGNKKSFRLRKLIGRSPARPYMRPAGDAVMGEHVKLVTDALNKALEEFGRD